jgi:excisionase family DNA binding protein
MEGTPLNRTGLEPLYSIDEAADLLGTGPRFILQLIKEHTLPSVQRGRELFVPESALIDYANTADTSAA